MAEAALSSTSGSMQRPIPLFRSSASWMRCDNLDAAGSINDTTMQICRDLVSVLDAYDGQKPLVSCQGQAMDGYSALANFVDIAKSARAVISESNGRNKATPEVKP